MKITIKDERKLYAIQDEFCALFPNLRLEFYKKPAQVKGKHSPKVIGSYAQTIGECRNIHKKGFLTVTPDMTASDVESSFDDVFGMYVKVLIRDGKVWVEPSMKNKFSLREQNNRS
jgi:hypothetical protein